MELQIGACESTQAHVSGVKGNFSDALLTQ